jgi:P27 family predicted phage terminase small subunit
VGNKGRVPQPPRLRALRGGSRVEPPFPASSVLPEPPEDLSAAARAEWDRVTTELGSDRLQHTDRAALELWVRTMPVYRASLQHAEQHGTVMTVLAADGTVKWAQQTPQIGLAIKLLPQLKALAVELGLSPAARARLAIPAKVETEDELGQFLRRGTCR